MLWIELVDCNILQFCPDGTSLFVFLQAEKNTSRIKGKEMKKFFIDRSFSSLALRDSSGV
jgi:hypothetical protein